MQGLGLLINMLVSVGVIGGADGPTAIFVTAGDGWWMMLLLIAAVIAAVVWLIVRAVRKRHGG